MTPTQFSKSCEHSSSLILARNEADEARHEYVKEFVGERLEALLKDCEGNLIERREAEEAIGTILRFPR